MTMKVHVKTSSNYVMNMGILGGGVCYVVYSKKAGKHKKIQSKKDGYFHHMTMTVTMTMTMTMTCSA